MRTRFIKVWCADCGTMQFAGECGHARVEVPADTKLVMSSLYAEQSAPNFQAFGFALHRALGAFVMPEPRETNYYRLLPDGSLQRVAAPPNRKD